MRIYLFVILFLLASTGVMGQSRGISYQAVIIDPTGQELPGVDEKETILSNKLLTIRFTIVNSNQVIDYQEIQTATTDQFGMLNLMIGSGSSTGAGLSSTLSGVAWDSTSRRLQVAIDIQAGNNFSEISSQELSYVPYAIYAAGAKPVGAAGGDLTGTYPYPVIADGVVTNSKIASGIDPSKVGLGNVDNTKDVDKPISTATQAAINTKEDGINKSSDGTFITNSDVKFPTEKATKTYVDNAITAATPDAAASVKGKIQLAGDLSGTADQPRVPALLQKANITYVDSAITKATPDADNVIKGKIKLAGDLGGTADAPVVPGLKLKADLAGATFTGSISATNLSGTNTGDQDLSNYELLSNKTNSLSDKSNVRYPTVNAVLNAMKKSSLADKVYTDISTYVWTKKSDSTTNNYRDGAAMAVLGEHLFIMGGWHPNRPDVTDNEIYRFSKDLTTTTRLPNAPWEGRHTYGSAYDENSVYVFGGDFNRGHYQTDAWKGTLQPDSSIAWKLQNDSMPCGQRILFGNTLHNGALYIIGGQKTFNYTDGGFSDVWKSVDEGVTWVKIASGLTQFSKNLSGCTVSYDGYLWVIGGGKYDNNIANRTYENDMWRSEDGVTWEKMPAPPFSGRQYPSVIVHDNRLFICFGATASGDLNDIWTLDSREMWEKSKTGPNARHAAASASYKGNLVIATGFLSNSNNTWALKHTDINIPGTIPNLIYKNAINSGNLSTSGRVEIATTNGDPELQAYNSLGALQIGVAFKDGNRMNGTMAGYGYLGNYNNYGLTFHVNNQLALKIDPNKKAIFNGYVNAPGISLSEALWFKNGSMISETQGNNVLLIGNNVKAHTSQNNSLFKPSNEPASFIRVSRDNGISIHTNLIGPKDTVVSDSTHQVALFNDQGLAITGAIKSNGTMTASKYRLSTLNIAPSSATDTGNTGEIRITSDYIYVCVAPNTWVRAPLNTW